MTLIEATKVLGMHYVSVHRLRREGKLKRAKDGVEAASVMAYLRQRSMPEGFIEGTEAARLLGIPRREMTGVCEAKLVTAIKAPHGGWWVERRSALELAKHRHRMATLGMRIEPPEGWITAEEACTRLRCGRSWLSRLARKGLIRRRMMGKLNSWYLEVDVEAYKAQEAVA